MRRTIVLLVILAAGAALGRPSVAVQMSLEELVGRSPVILHGQVTAQRCIWDDGTRTIHTYTEVRVAEYLKTDATSPSVVLKHLGGKVEDLEARLLGGPELSVGDEVVLFLERRQDGYLRVIGLAQGLYRVAASQTGPLAIQQLDAGALIVAAPGGGEPAPARLLLSDLKTRIARLLARDPDPRSR